MYRRASGIVSAFVGRSTAAGEGDDGDGDGDGDAAGDESATA